MASTTGYEETKDERTRDYPVW